MKFNHSCKHRQTCDNYIYSTCEGCNLELLERHLNRCYRNTSINQGDFVAISSLYSALRCVQEELHSLHRTVRREE